MGNYECKKCGETANSKCARSRNVFPSNMFATMVGNQVRMGADRIGSVRESWRRESDSNRWLATFTFELILEAQDEAEAMEKAAFHELISLPEATAKIVACNHHWELTSPTCEMGCCKKAE